MRFPEPTVEFDQGVGATAEARLVPLLPLVEHFAREMGELPGRLMVAASFLDDIQLMPDWASLGPEARQSIEQAHALTVSVMIRLLGQQEGDGCRCGSAGGAAADSQQLPDHGSGGER